MPSRPLAIPARCLAAALLVSLLGCSNAEYIEIEPTRLELTRRGEVQRLAARAMDHRGHYYPEITFTWESENPEIATVDERGNVKAVSSGSTYIHAKAGDLDAKALVEVVLPERIEIQTPELTLSLESGERVEPKIVVYDAQGRILKGREVTLKARDPKIVTIDGQGGLWPAQVGETVVDAEIEGKTGSIQVKVTK